MPIRPYLLMTLSLLLLGLGSCRKEPPAIDFYRTPVPTTYDFPYVDYSGQTTRLDQLEEMIAYVETASETGAQLDKSVLTAMFANTGGDANGNFSFTSEKDIRSKTFEPHIAIIEGYFDQAVEASLSSQPASNGVAGIMTAGDGSGGRLYDAQGFEPSELIEKRLMGALCYYQATAVYLGEEKMEVDNENQEDGESTEMAHHWDESYGYFGAPKDFPEVLENVRFWAKYCVRRNPLIASNEKLGEALRAGRAAILWHRYDERDSAITVVRTEWENVAAATVMHYINQALSNAGDDYGRNHVLSEAVGFTHALFYNPDRRISEAQIQQVLDLIGSNLYEVSTSDLQDARDLLAAIYGWESIKSSL